MRESAFARGRNATAVSDSDRSWSTRSSSPKSARCWPTRIGPDWRSSALPSIRAAPRNSWKDLTENEIWQVLQFAEPSRRAEIFGYFDEERQVAMLDLQDPKQVANLVDEIPADDRVDLIQELDDQRVDEILPLLPAEGSTQHPTAAVLSGRDRRRADDDRSRHADRELDGSRGTGGTRSSSPQELETIYYLYVVDDDNLLRGIVSARQLVSSLGKPDRTLGEMMETDLVVASGHAKTRSRSRKRSRNSICWRFRSSTPVDSCWESSRTTT